MKVLTGFGYLTDSNGRITDKYVLSVGEHPLKPGYTQTEVACQKDLDAIIVWKKTPSQEEIAQKEVDVLIVEKQRELAIQALKDEGKLDSSGKVVSVK